MKTRLVYILAASHSGSTLLAMLLGSHREICTVGELKLTSLGAPDRYRCSCRELLKRCPFWAKVRESMAERGFDFDVSNAGTNLFSGSSRYTRMLLRPLHRGTLLEFARDVALWLSPNWRRNLPRIQARNLALIESLLSVSGARIIVDSSKIALRLKYLLRIPELDVKVIRLIRDGRAVAATYMNPAGLADATEPALRCGGMGGSRENERLTTAEATHEWRRSNEEAELLLAGLGASQWIEVRYEDLCARTEATLSRIFSFLGTAPSLISQDFRSVDHHVIGNGMRLDTGSDVCLDERWRQTMGFADLAVFNAIAGSLNQGYGYS